jgi:hydrophobic/amphiphilic exporter-1 (mainly G- bacteria), HAE1 family
MTDKPSQTEKTYSLPIRRPVTTAMVFLTLVVFGWKSYQELPINLMPDISYPTLTVRTEMESAAPEDVEKLVTRPLEETLSIVGGMVEISSTSSAGISEIVMEFTWDTDMNVAQQDVRDRLDLFDPPKEVTEKPVILRYDPTLDPVLRVAITGSDLSGIADEAEREARARQELLEIRKAAELHIKSDLEGEQGIAQVLIKGGREEEIQILADSERLKNLGLSIAHVVSALAQQNINYSGGRLVEGKTEYLVRTLNEYQDVAEIGETIVGNVDGNQIRLQDVASVMEGEKDRETIVRIDGKEAVEMEIHKWGDTNTVHVCNMLKDLFKFEREPTLMERLKESVKARFAQEKAEPAPGMEMPAEFKKMEMNRELTLAQSLRARLPKYAELSLISDQSRFIVASIKEVQNSAIVGGLLALLILYFFLRELRSTIIIGVAIPISVVATFVPMFMRDISLNIMSLGGLALGVGMLVDNSIVVLESIFRCAEEGDGTVDAAHRGTKEVGSAVTASTLTTIAVFLPIAFVEGIAGQLFGDQALTVTFSLIASLLVALFLIPMVKSREKLALRAGRDVIWVLRAFREARNQNNHPRLVAALLVIPYGVRYAFDCIAETAMGNFGPIFSGARRIVNKMNTSAAGKAVKAGLVLFAVGMFALACVFVALQVWKGMFAAMSAGVVGLLILMVPVFAVLAVAIIPFCLVGSLFMLELLLRILGVTLVTLFFIGSVVFMSVAFVVGWVLRILFWIPLWLFDLSFRAFRESYAVVLKHSLRFSPVILLIVAALAVHSGMSATGLGRELIPPMKQGEFSIRMEAHAGTRLEETERRARDLERIAMAVPEVEAVAVEIGQEKSKAEGNRGENIADFTVRLKDPEVNAQRQDEIIERMRVALQGATSDEITFSLPTLFSFKTAIELQVMGDDLRELRQVGDRTVQALVGIPGLRDVELSMKEGYPEIIIELDRDLCASKNLDPDAVGQRLKNEVGGNVATKFNRAGNKVDIRVRTDRERLSSLEDLRNLSVVDGYPPIPLASVASILVQEGPSEVRRIDQRQVAVVTASVEGRDLGAVSRDIEARCASVEKPADFEFLLAGQNRELQVSYKSLQFALALAIFLVYVVMACQFESIWHPALVMFSVPLAFIGVVYVLVWQQIDLSIVVYIGGIILAGIVVNDAIVLVDYINQLRARGMKKRDAVVEAGRVRLRPIIMTTLTTVLGLIPMAVWRGEGAEIRQPMAITVMAGLSSATILTLIIIPMVYDLFGGRDKA